MLIWEYVNRQKTLSAFFHYKACRRWAEETGIAPASGW